MRSRDTQNLLNPWKTHLHRLPDLSEPVPPIDVEKGLVIFPMFQTVPEDISLEHHIVRSGCWARRSWVLFSDAPQMGIGIKFYVEMQVKDRVIPILRDNHVDIDNDVLFFDGSYFEQVERVHLGKKLAFANDSQFADYDWVWQIDTDCFMASPTRERFPFFEKATHLPVVPQAVETYRVNPPGSATDFHWLDWSLGPNMTDDARLSEWFRLINVLAGPEIEDVYSDKNSMWWKVGGGIYGLPMKQYHTHHKADLEWLARAGQVLQDDEAVFSLWMMQDKPLQSLLREIGMVCVYVPADVSLYNQGGKPYILHVASFNYEYLWREAIDAL